MASGSAVAELKRVIGSDGRALLQRFNLLRPLVEQMVIAEAISQTPVDDDSMMQARQGLLERRGYETMDEWPQLLEELGRPEQAVLDQLKRGIQQRATARNQFAVKAEARFLERKNELDQVVYSLLRLENRFLARELYLQIESGESNFADLAKSYAEGPERNTNGIVGPVPYPAHPLLVESGVPGDVAEPFSLVACGAFGRYSPYLPDGFLTECAGKCLMSGSTSRPQLP